MSGGVDSTVAAYLLKKEGHEVVGVNFNFCDPTNRRGEHCEPTTRRGEHCEPAPVGSDHELVGEKLCEPSNRRGEHCEPTSELENIAKTLNIRIIYRDFRKEFHDKIIKYFVEEYEHGRTPNPCAICNATMKFAKLLQIMREENCDKIATGHYANVVAKQMCSGEHCEPLQNEALYCIKKSVNSQKDQSYMLYRLSQDQLSHIIFPIGNMDKNEVRNIASTLGLTVANKKDSQDVCFISNTLSAPLDYKEFIKRYEFGDDYKEKIALGKLKEEDILSKPYFQKGEFVDTNGNVLGFHNGIINYTIGQRRGINIAFGERKFVVNIDTEKNQVVLGNNEDLMSQDFKIRDVVFSGYSDSKESIKELIGKKFFAKLRYRHEGTLCEVVGVNESFILNCHLLSPVRAITKGQSAVFYDEEGRVMLGGIII